MRDLRLVPYIVAVLVMVLLIVGAAYTAPGERQLTFKDNETTVELEQGQTLVVTLDSNPTTGFSWQAVESDDGVLEQVGEAQFKSGSNLVGAGGQETLRFRTVQPGTTMLQLVYHRPWESVPPEKTFTVEVVVR